MKQRFAFLADYAGLGNQGKLIIVGTFDTVHDRQGIRPIPVPPCYLIASFEASIVEGTQHSFQVALNDEDGQPVLDQPVSIPLPFRPQGPGRPFVANAIVHSPDLSVPELGEYRFDLRIDGAHIGDVPLFVTPARAKA
jgi:hypothetical protein